jgi:Flp pilus assembly protein TadG
MSVLRNSLMRLGLTQFISNRRANIGMMFGLALVPMTIAAGAAFDYTIAAADRTKLQAANDDAIIAVMRALQANPSLSAAQQKAIVQNYLTAEVPKLNATITNYSVAANGQVTLDTSANIPRTLSRVMPDASGAYITVVAAHSAALATTPSVEVALVLDHTGSMSESSGGMMKITALQQAANSLVSTIMNGSTTEVAVVPFSMSVNVGSQYATANWVDTLGKSSIHWKPAAGTGGSVTKPAWATSRFDLFNKLGVAWRGCFEGRPGIYASSESPPTAATPDSLFVPIFAPDEPGNSASGSGTFKDKNGNSYSTSNSYINDGYTITNGKEQGTWAQILADATRYQNAGSLSSKIGQGSAAPNDQGPNYACDPTPMLRLTSSLSSVQAKINSLSPSGNTNILDGLMWGWRAISPNAPFADGKSYNWNPGNPTQPNKKVIVLMTDGYNTWDAVSNPSGSQYSDYGYYTDNRLATNVTDGTSARNAMDAAVAKGCANLQAIVDANNNPVVTIYTVGFSIPSDPIDAQGLALLQGCASTINGQKQYYLSTSSAQLISAFGLIADSINQLRLTQ